MSAEGLVRLHAYGRVAAGPRNGGGNLKIEANKWQPPAMNAYRLHVPHSTESYSAESAQHRMQA